jgi:hypothetical protein
MYFSNALKILNKFCTTYKKADPKDKNDVGTEFTNNVGNKQIYVNKNHHFEEYMNYDCENTEENEFFIPLEKNNFILIDG